MYFYNSVNQDYDFFINDGSIGNSILWFSLDKLIIARGVFNYDWQISDKYLETGDTELRKKIVRAGMYYLIQQQL